MITVSEEYKCFLWLPPKTGTKHAAEIFRKFNFITKLNENGEIYIPQTHDPILNHHHEMELFKDSENYKLICTGRNPYSRMVSYFKMIFVESSPIDQERFLKFLTSFFYPNKNDKINLIAQKSFNESWELRVPDYYIRLESIYDDYQKIPFVKSTEFYLSGELEKMCGTKINENTRNKKFWKEFYNEESADMVYYNFSKYFDLLGYKKDSYKF